MKVVKLNTLHSEYIDHVIRVMREQHQISHGCDIDVDKTKTYCLTNVYCMLRDDDNLAGFFSLSRFDFAINNPFLCILMFIYNILFGRVFVYDVYIFPQYRQQGLGKHMISLAAKHVQDTFWFANTVCLHAASESLVNFYEKCGFHLVRVHNSNIYMEHYITS
jgi:ribosomal protein S18 acetylase RimI-like enzyme